jgi:cation diffusion facilitator CzcD-associated flavoprotein CzcO
MKKRGSQKEPTPAETVDYQVIVIGSGFSGINAGICLKRAGITDFVILERADDVGGTWRDNTYPGCACDVPSVVYSYSFEQHPDWSRSFAGNSEIQQYIRDCLEKFDLGPWLRFGADVRQAVFDDRLGIWRLTLTEGKQLTARAVVSAVGGLVNPAYPVVPGLDTFKGTQFHTARWRHDVDLKGKRVAVIGTGASAVQVIPAIQPTVARLKVFQRTPAWVLPKPDFAVEDRTRRLFARIPVLQRALRNGIFAASEAIFGPLVIVDSPAARLLEWVSRSFLMRQITDPELRRKLTPDFHIGCKRVLLSSDYYPALARQNVDVVTDAIVRVTPRGVVTADGTTHEVDVIVLATGFRLDIGNAPFEVRGLDGVSLSDVWGRRGSKAYLGMVVSGFPNWFLMLGPNTGPGHTSVLIYTEAQANYIVQALRTLFRRNLRYLNVRQSEQDAWHEALQARMRHTSWTSGCRSWYLDVNGENHALFPGLASEYVLRARTFRPEKYDLTVFAPVADRAVPA